VNTDPARLGAVARFFGMQSAPLDGANVLEIGCATGGNILPMAARYPDATFTGVDLSENQISTAQEKAKGMGLSNIKLIAASITDISFEGQKFDYIIAHGVYSWVPSNVQDRILEICEKHLSNAGIAYISYNTLPGWNAVKTVRDMMLYHVNKIEDTSNKIVEARNILKFVAANIKSDKGPHKEQLEQEISTLQKAEDNYLLHDHLEVINDPCYFHEFMEQASNYNLSYLGDSELQSMYLGNQTDEAAHALSQLNDVVAQEQYVDFITNRRFRSTILCKSGTTLTRKLSPEILDGMTLVPNFGIQKPLKLAQGEVLDTLTLISLQDGETQASLSGGIACAGYLKLLQRLPSHHTLESVVQAVSQDLHDTPNDEVKTEISGIILKLVFSGIVSLVTETTPCLTTPSKKPAAFISARIEALTKNLVPNLHHDNVKLSNDQRLAIQYVNGSNTTTDIAAEVEKHIEKGELNLSANGTPMKAGSETLEKYLPEYVDTLLVFLANKALLVG